jgi:tRNA pseudouridine38-40 synthase
MMHTRIAFLIEYDGGRFHGWQRQESLPTVQGAIETALYHYCGQQLTLHCAGRTDAGVHSRGQVAHTDIAGTHDPFRVMEAVNFYLKGKGVAIINATLASADFHARFSALARHYEYRLLMQRAPLVLEEGRIWRIATPLHIEPMRIAASLLCGTHDFTSFRDKECQSASPVKTLDTFNILQQKNRLTFAVSAPSFLHHQVRIMVGTLVEIGRGRFPPECIPEMLAARHRRAAGMTAPAEGLYFMRVDYPESLW